MSPLVRTALPTDILVGDSARSGLLTRDSVTVFPHLANEGSITEGIAYQEGGMDIEQQDKQQLWASSSRC